VAFTCPASVGSVLTLTFRMWADAAQPGALDPSHVGPMAIYLKQVSDMQADSAAGPGWFKIWDEGYDSAAKRWSTEKLIDNKGLLSIKVPSVPTGYYLMRQEMITLQDVTNDVVNAQPYVGCAQLFIQGDDSASLPPSDKQVSIPGHLDPAHPGLTFNVYHADPSTYSIPGPAVFVPTSGGVNTNTKPVATQQSGVIPSNCLVKNGNWCATPLPAYSDSTGCWDAVADCHNQLRTCYDTAPPTGSKGCRVWDAEMCMVVMAACERQDFQSPPPEKLGGAQQVDEPAPGPLPEAANQGATGNDEARGDSVDAAAAQPVPVVSRCMMHRREMLRRRMN
jgi:hypothetical protein